ncbi:MAG: hypothetical protein U1E59_05490 [Amaricoccus sp.]
MQMYPSMEARIAYGRSIRERALCLHEAYGELAAEKAQRAADEPGLAAAERSFWEAVAARLARQAGGLPAH